MKAGIYIRVSTDTQTTQNQRRELEAFCDRQGWQIAGLYDDSGISGAKADRPGLDRMMKDAAAGRIGVVVVWKIDRLARSVVHLLQVLQSLQSAGVAFVSTTQQIDTTTAYGRMVLTFLGAVAEFERSLIIERVKAGIGRAKSQGVHCGRPSRDFDLSQALRMREQGIGLRGIAKTLGVGCATVHRAISAVPKAP